MLSFPAFSADADSNATSKNIVSPSTVERGLGFFDLEDGTESAHPEPLRGNLKSDSGFPIARLGGGGGFPITGFSRTSGGGRKSDVGAFLAQRGGNDA